jgi:hypothetical protein
MSIELDRDIETEVQKLDEKIKKIQQAKAQLAEKLQEEKQLLDLARKIGAVIITEFQGVRFTYIDLKLKLEDKLITDFDRNFFGLEVLAANDPRRPKQRGRKKHQQNNDESNEDNENTTLNTEE